MLALVYDIHGNLPALEAVLADAADQGADGWLLGGDLAAFGAWPAETVARLRELPAATWIRGNTERWLVDRSDLPVDQPMHRAVLACREELGEALADELAALPERARVDADTAAVHASPVSDMRSFLPEPGDDEHELLAGVEEGRLVFGHTHLAFRRVALREGAPPVELVNPGSVGMPLDGDHRAAYALLRDGGQVEHRRVVYDHAAGVAELKRRYGDEPWVRIVCARLEQARFDV
jgi:predicted phosphodiesterase